MKNKIIAILKSIDWKNISAATYTRYILMIIAIINLILTGVGANPIKASDVYKVVSDVLTCVIFIVNTWKNNSVTGNAIAADGYLKDLQRVDTERGEDKEDAEG